MVDVGGISSGSSVGSVSLTATRPPLNASAELEKYEKQRSDWVHCASSKTSEGKAKIEEITTKIDRLKAQMRRAEDAKNAESSRQTAAAQAVSAQQVTAQTATAPGAPPGQAPREGPLGARLDVWA